MQRAFLERRYGVRIRTVVGLEEGVLVLPKRGLALVGETPSESDWEWLASELATSRDLRKQRGAGQARPLGVEPRR